MQTTGSADAKTATFRQIETRCRRSFHLAGWETTHRAAQRGRDQDRSVATSRPFSRDPVAARSSPCRQSKALNRAIRGWNDLDAHTRKTPYRIRGHA